VCEWRVYQGRSGRANPQVEGDGGVMRQRAGMGAKTLDTLDKSLDEGTAALVSVVGPLLRVRS